MMGMTNLTSAQAAQQRNRAHDGRYAEKAGTDPGALDLDSPMSAEDAAGWAVRGFAIDGVAMWRKDGFTPFSAESWARRWFTPSEATTWRDRDFLPDEAAAWRDAGFTPTAAVNHAEFGFDARTAARWRETGGPTPPNPPDPVDASKLGIGVADLNPDQIEAANLAAMHLPRPEPKEPPEEH